MKTIQDIIEGQQVYCIAAEEMVQRACERMAEHQIGALIVLDGDQVAGIFTERDLLIRVVVPGLDTRQTCVGHVMSTDLVIVSPTDTQAACREKMQRARCRHLPVVFEGRLVGIVSLRDLLQIELDEKREELEFLQAYMGR